LGGEGRTRRKKRKNLFFGKSIFLKEKRMKGKTCLYCSLVRSHYLETQFERFVQEIQSVYGVKRRAAERVANELKVKYRIKNVFKVPSLLLQDNLPCCRPENPCLPGNKVR
jgi:hypothetical protein